MIGILRSIFAAVSAIGTMVLWAIETAVNAIVAAIAALAVALLALLPTFPEAPEPPSDGVLAWLTWIVPLGPILAGFALLLSCWLTFLAIKIGLKWVKAL